MSLRSALCRGRLSYPEPPSTQYLRSLIPKTIKGRFFWLFVFFLVYGGPANLYFLVIPYEYSQQKSKLVSKYSPRFWNQKPQISPWPPEHPNSRSLRALNGPIVGPWGARVGDLDPLS